MSSIFFSFRLWWSRILINCCITLDTLCMEHSLPSKPEHPLDSDCCGQGCDRCVLDVYAEEVKIWEEECQQILSGERKEQPASSQQEKVRLLKLLHVDRSAFRCPNCWLTITYTWSTPLQGGLSSFKHIYFKWAVFSLNSPFESSDPSFLCSE